MNSSLKLHKASVLRRPSATAAYSMGMMMTKDLPLSISQRKAMKDIALKDAADRPASQTGIHFIDLEKKKANRTSQCRDRSLGDCLVAANF